MKVAQTLPFQGLTSSAASARPAATVAADVPVELQDKVSVGGSHSELTNNLKWAGVAGVCGALGYAGSVAHGIPYVGPTLSGIAGAVFGASAGAAAAAALPGEHIKTGAVIGLVGGAIVGANFGGTTAANVAMSVAGATVPVGLLTAIFSAAS